jgi:hypothetical protein
LPRAAQMIPPSGAINRMATYNSTVPTRPHRAFRVGPEPTEGRVSMLTASPPPV